jgi:hypothetical protein
VPGQARKVANQPRAKKVTFKLCQLYFISDNSPFIYPAALSAKKDGIKLPEAMSMDGEEELGNQRSIMNFFVVLIFIFSQCNMKELSLSSCPIRPRKYLSV